MNRFEVTIGADDFDMDEVEIVRTALQDLLKEPGRSQASRTDIQEVLALSDENRLAEVSRRFEDHEPTEDELLEQRVLDASMGGGLVQLQALEQLGGEVRGTRFEARLISDLFRARMTCSGLDGQVAAVIWYLEEPTADPAEAMANAATVLFEAVRSVRLDLADSLIAANPALLEARNSSGNLAEQLQTIPHSLLARSSEDDALAVASWARTLPYPDDTLARLYGVWGHMLERTGRTGEALTTLLADWDRGMRSDIHADRISILASRAGDEATACRVLRQALDRTDLGGGDRRGTPEAALPPRAPLEMTTQRTHTR